MRGAAELVPFHGFRELATEPEIGQFCGRDTQVTLDLFVDLRWSGQPSEARTFQEVAACINCCIKVHSRQP